MPRHRSGLATAHRAVGLGSEATAHATLAARTPLRPLIAVTISYPHGEQLHKLEHCLRRLEGVGALVSSHLLACWALTLTLTPALPLTLPHPTPTPTPNPSP